MWGLGHTICAPPPPPPMAGGGGGGGGGVQLTPIDCLGVKVHMWHGFNQADKFYWFCLHIARRALSIISYISSFLLKINDLYIGFSEYLVLPVYVKEAPFTVKKKISQGWGWGNGGGKATAVMPHGHGGGGGGKVNGQFPHPAPGGGGGGAYH